MEYYKNIRYCGEKCPIGTKKSEEILDANNSAYDAALDFGWFTNDCFKTCPYKDKHNISEEE